MKSYMYDDTVHRITLAHYSDNTWRYAHVLLGKIIETKTFHSIVDADSYWQKNVSVTSKLMEEVG